jgi:hypothetical protein
MCIDALYIGAPCVRTCSYIENEQNQPVCSYATRIALSIASIAIAIISAAAFLATGDLIALGVSIACSIAAIVLWPQRGGGRAPQTPPIIRVQETFGATLPQPPLIIHTQTPPNNRRFEEQNFFMPPSPFPPVISYGPSENRVKVGDRGRNQPPVMSPVMGTPIQNRPRGGEDRIQVGNHGREPFQRVPPSYSVHHQEEPSTPRNIFGGLTQNYPLRHETNLPITPPDITPEGEKRIQVGRGGHIGTGTLTHRGDERFSIGSNQRK